VTEVLISGAENIIPFKLKDRIVQFELDIIREFGLRIFKVHTNKK